MKNRKKHAAKADTPRTDRQTPAFSLKLWHVAAGLMAGLIAAIWTYQPALRGPFVFDDMYLPFYSHDFGTKSFLPAIHGVRPLLMISFWVNHHFSGLDPYSYHLLNVFLHLANSLLVFFIVRRLLTWAGVDGWRRDWLPVFAGGLFLLHPVQTESVAYVASRSENLSVFFFYSAFALFLYRKSQAISWRATAGILLLYAAAATTKEHTVVLPALLVLTDYFWNPGFKFEGIRRNWRLYAPLSAGAVLGLLAVWRVLRDSISAGFALKDLSWYDYFFTQCRAIWVYFRLFVAPFGQNVDYDYPISRTIFQHGAIFGLLALLAAIACAWYFRRKYPLASYGFLTALLLLAPTSSFIPIQDAVAERRMYLPMVGFILIALEFARRWNASRTAVAGTLAGVLLAAGVLTDQRNEVWGSETALWEDSVSKAPQNPRGHFHLASAYFAERNCEAAEREFKAVARLQKPDYRLLLDWALADDCLNRPEEALAKLRRATGMNPTAHAYSLIGMVYAKQKKFGEALAALNKAVEINPRFDMTYVYRGNIYVMNGEVEAAVRDYRRALELNPYNEPARNTLAKIEARLGGAR